MKEIEIHKDEIEWLVSVYNTCEDEQVKNESYEKLIAYGLTDKQIEDIFDKTKSVEGPKIAFDKYWAKQAERNEHEKYTVFEMIKIFFLGPYDLFRHFDSGLKVLRDFNYKTKFRQRLILLISGTIFWILLSIGVFEYYEYKSIQDIEKADISDWERNRINNPTKE